MVLAVEDMYVLVANGVVKLAINDIQQADNLRERVADILHHAHVGFVCPYYDEHDLAFVVGAQNQCTQLSLMRMLIIEGDTQSSCILAYAIADAVVNIGHEVALSNIQYLIKAVRYMEA